jgi:protein TonB
MFVLIESNGVLRRASDWAPRVASLAAHTALIAAAVLATQRVVASSAPALIPVTTVWQLPPRPNLPAAPSMPMGTTPAPAWAVLPTPPVNISPDIPPPGPGEILPGPSGDPLPGPFTATVPGGVPGTSHAPMDARYVEERPVMLTHPALHYPEVLRQAGVEGRVMVEAVLDTLGRAEPASLRVTDSPNPLFDREALAVVLGSRYRPGRVDGHAVRVRVQVPVAFTIRR